jgi:chromatin remodeling complex protein RSC6
MKDPKLMCAVKEDPVEDDEDEDEDDSEEPASKKRKKSKKAKKEKKSKKSKKDKKSSSSSKKGAIVKGATSSFMYFSTDARPLVKEENPEMAFGDIAKAIGEKWRGLSDKEKKPFDALAAEDKARYNAEIKAGGVKASSVKKAKGAAGGTGGGFQAPVALSKELGAFLKAKQMPRTEVTKQMWVYIKEHELQDPNNKKQIICDDALKKVRVRGCDGVGEGGRGRSAVWGGGVASGRLISAYAVCVSVCIIVHKPNGGMGAYIRVSIYYRPNSISDSECCPHITLHDGCVYLCTQNGMAARQHFQWA